jgi:hypothetical protein
LQIFNETLTERCHGALSGKAGSNILGDGSLVGEIKPFLPDSTLEKQLAQPRGTYPAGAGFSSTSQSGSNQNELRLFAALGSRV